MNMRCVSHNQRHSLILRSHPFPSSVQDNPHLRRAPLPAEWEHFLHAASRVKSLKHCVLEDDISDEIFDAVAIYRPKLLLLPNIERLEWLDETADTDISLHASMFLGPRLRSLTLTKAQSPSHLGAPDFPNIVALLKTVHYMECRLDTLQVEIGEVASKDVGAATTALVLANDLKEFLCQEIPLPNDAVVRLARLPSLRNAGISLQPGTTIEELDGPLFPVVKHLDISLDNLAERACRKLISNIASTCLETLSVTFRQEPSHDVLSSFIRQLASSQNALELRTFHLLQDSARYKELEGQLPGRPDLVIHCLTLLPMFNMRNLVDIEIRSPHVDLDDTALILIIKAFPGLRRLCCIPNYYCGRAPKATLNSIVTAARCLPHLQELGFPVDVSTQTVQTIDQFSPANWTCSRLHVADSPLSQEQMGHVAQFLHIWFRHVKLRIIASDPDVPGDLAHAEEREVYAIQWEECNRLMHPWEWWTDEMTARLEES